MLCAIGQDGHFSQFYAAPQYINPALIGRMQGNIRVHVHHRQQWRSVVKQNSFLSDYVSYEQLKNKWGFGAYVLNNRAGKVGLNEINAMATGSYLISVDSSAKHNLSMGLQAGIIQKSLSADVNWDNQYDIDQGDFDPTLSSGENLSKFNYLLFDLNFGIYYYYNNPHKKFKPYAGFSGYHLTNPKETFYSLEDNRLPIRWVGYGGWSQKINHEILIDFNVLYMHQGNATNLNVGALMHYHFDGSEYTLLFGPYYRNRDAVSIHGGLIFKKMFLLRMSYDINTSTLSSYSQGRGAYELSFSYIRNKKKYEPSLLPDDLPIY